MNSPITLLLNSTLETIDQMREGLSSRKVDPVIDDETFFVLAIVILAIGFMIALSGIATNIINIRTFIKMGVEDGVTSLFMAISFSDLLYVVLVCVRNLPVIVHTVEKDGGVWLVDFDPVVPGYFSDSCTYIFYSTTTLLSAFLAVARCMCVAKPLHFKHMFTRRRCVIASVVCFLFPASCETAIMLNMGTTRYFNAETNSSRLGLWMSGDRQRVKDMMRFITNFILPLGAQIIAGLCVTVMVTKLRQAARFRTQLGVTREEDSGTTKGDDVKLTGKDRQVVKQVVLILLIFIVFNVQKIVESLLEFYDSRLDYGGAYNNLQAVLNHLGTVFQSLNASLNIFVYFYYNSKFRSLCFSR